MIRVIETRGFLNTTHEPKALRERVYSTKGGNSCLTHVCDVLRAGGLPVPTSPGQQIREALKLFRPKS